MAVRSRRIYGPAALTTSDTVVYTVPTGRTLIVRSVVWHNTDSVNAVMVRMSINGTTSTHRLWNFSIPANGTVVLDHPVILNPGDTIAVRSGSTQARVFIDGSLLLGAPE